VPPEECRSETIDAEECLRLIRSRPLGRVALSIGALPTIIAVAFRVVGRKVVFGVDSPALFAALSDNVVAFEVDDIDAAALGWSVVVVGRSRTFDDHLSSGAARRHSAEQRIGISFDRVSGLRTLGRGLVSSG
jgi:Pyridoxamine 5'-phosphate oxidase